FLVCEMLKGKVALGKWNCLTKTTVRSECLTVCIFNLNVLRVVCVPLCEYECVCLCVSVCVCVCVCVCCVFLNLPPYIHKWNDTNPRLILTSVLNMNHLVFVLSL